MEKLKKQVEDFKAERKKLKRRYERVKKGQPPDSASEPEEEENEDGTPKKKKSLPNDPDRIKKAIQKLDERIKNRQVEIEQKDELKTIALGTSKINYLDPRITAAWCKKHDVPFSGLAFSVASGHFLTLTIRPPIARFQLRKSFPRHFETSSLGLWMRMQISSTEIYTHYLSPHLFLAHS